MSMSTPSAGTKRMGPGAKKQKPPPRKKKEAGDNEADEEAEAMAMAILMGAAAAEMADAELGADDDTMDSSTRAASSTESSNKETTRGPVELQSQSMSLSGTISSFDSPATNSSQMSETLKGPAQETRKGTSLDDATFNSPAPLRRDNSRRGEPSAENSSSSRGRAPKRRPSKPAVVAGGEAVSGVAVSSAPSTPSDGLGAEPKPPSTSLCTVPPESKLGDFQLVCGLGTGGTSSVVLCRLAPALSVVPATPKSLSLSRMTFRAATPSRFGSARSASRGGISTNNSGSRLSGVRSSSSESDLGRGGSSAGPAQQKRQALFAVKVMEKSRLERETQVKRLAMEKRILEKASGHPFVAKMHCCFQNEHSLYFVLDFCEGGDMYYHLTKSPGGRFTEAATQFYAAEVVLALEHLHEQGIVYRDLKLENVMLGSDGHVKLVDFGLSKDGMAPAEDVPLSPCGSIVYMAPELLEQKGSTAIDWWCLGILMHEMLAGNTPWKSSRPDDILAELRVYKPVALSKEHLSSKAVALIGGLLTRDTKKRLGKPGTRQNGWELKTHPFWWPSLKDPSGWAKLLAKDCSGEGALQPPFVPDPAHASSPPIASTTTPAASTAASAADAQSAGGGASNFVPSQRQRALDAVLRLGKSAAGGAGSAGGGGGSGGTAADTAALEGFVDCARANLVIPRELLGGAQDSSRKNSGSSRPRPRP